jgi:nuclear pore complex protein Nup98-Nup96
LLTCRRRKTSVKALLHRHTQLRPEDLSFLVDTLKVPAEWIHEAEAAEVASAGETFKEFQALISAGLIDGAHRILTGKLALEAVLRDDLALLRKLCTSFGGRLPDEWEYGGKVSLSVSCRLHLR